jgi:hypothetical protein
MTEFEFMILPYLHPFPEPGSALFMGNHTPSLLFIRASLFMGNFQIHHNFEV